MNPNDLRSRLIGVVGFPVTPFLPDRAVDFNGLHANVSAMAAHPFCALVIAGGTGELYSLTLDEHRLIVRAAIEAATDRTAIIVGVGGSVATACEQARQAWQARTRRDCCPTIRRSAPRRRWACSSTAATG